MNHSVFYDKSHHYKPFGRDGNVKAENDEEDLMKDLTSYLMTTVFGEQPLCPGLLNIFL